MLQPNEEAGPAKKWLASQSVLEQLVENRFASLERLLAFEIVFHAMAARVAQFWCA